MTTRIYLDHAATTPMRCEARAAVAEGMARWANPSSPHAEGRAARAMLEEARGRIAAAFGWTGEVILTSGASEAIALALPRSRAVFVGATEHDAVLRIVPDAPRLSVDADGLVEWPSRSNGEGGAAIALPPDGSIMAIQTANSETGILQPQPDTPATWLADASQTAGKLPLPDADLIVVSAHKLGGPPGIGALLVRDLGMLTPTGGQERGYRGGTENLPGALGFAAALEAPRDWFAAMALLRERLDAAIVAAGGEVIGQVRVPANAGTQSIERSARDPGLLRSQEHGALGATSRIPTIASYRMPGISSAAQLIRFDMAGFAVSAGSACSSGSLRPSPVLAAMGMPAEEAGQVIRVSFGWTTTEDEVARFADAWRKVARR